VPRTLDGHPDARIVAFTFGVSMLTAIGFALAPWRHVVKSDAASALTEAPATAGGGRRWTARHALVVAQVALSLVVLVGAGLCLRSLRALDALDPGLPPARGGSAW